MYLFHRRQPHLTISSIVTGSTLNPNEKDDNPVFGDNSSSGTLLSSFEANTHAESHDFDMDLDPELQSIAAQARAEHRHRREDSANDLEELASLSAPSWTIRTSSNSSQGIGQKVEIKVRFVIDPRVVETSENQRQIKALKKVLKIIMMDVSPLSFLSYFIRAKKCTRLA